MGPRASLQLKRHIDLDGLNCKGEMNVLKENDVFINEWQIDPNRIGAKKGEGHNTLRTYRLF